MLHSGDGALFLLVRISLPCLSSYFVSWSQELHCSSTDVQPPAHDAVATAIYCIKLRHQLIFEYLEANTCLLQVYGRLLSIANKILVRKEFWTLRCVVTCTNKTFIFPTRFQFFPPSKNLWLWVCVGCTVSAVTGMGPFPRYLKFCILGTWDYLQKAVAMSSFDEDALILGEMWSAPSCNISATPPGREREREHRKNDNLYFQNHNLIRTTVDNKPKQNQTTDSPSFLSSSLLGKIEDLCTNSNTGFNETLFCHYRNWCCFRLRIYCRNLTPFFPLSQAAFISSPVLEKEHIFPCGPLLIWSEELPISHTHALSANKIMSEIMTCKCFLVKVKFYVLN